MNTLEIIASLDDEIERLSNARAILASAQPMQRKIVPANASIANPRRLGAATAASPVTKQKRKRNLSPEGRKRIAEAVQARWAKQKKDEAAAARAAKKAAKNASNNGAVAPANGVE
jgi:hypothetical protein